MIETAVQLLSAWFAHETYGINAMTQSLPHATIGGGSEALPPATIPIYNDVDSKGVATSMVPPSLPAIVVLGDESRPLEEVGKAGSVEECTIAITYMTKDSADDITANRQWKYLRRGIRRSLRKYLKGSLAGDYRELNGERVIALAIGKTQRITMAGEDATPVSWGWFLVTVRVADSIE